MRYATHQFFCKLFPIFTLWKDTCAHWASTIKGLFEIVSHFKWQFVNSTILTGIAKKILRTSCPPFCHLIHPKHINGLLTRVPLQVTTPLLFCYSKLSQRWSTSGFFWDGFLLIAIRWRYTFISIEFIYWLFTTEMFANQFIGSSFFSWAWKMMSFASIVASASIW